MCLVHARAKAVALPRPSRRELAKRIATALVIALGFPLALWLSGCASDTAEPSPDGGALTSAASCEISPLDDSGGLHCSSNVRSCLADCNGNSVDPKCRETCVSSEAECATCVDGAFYACAGETCAAEVDALRCCDDASECESYRALSIGACRACTSQREAFDDCVPGDCLERAIARCFG